MKTLRNWAGLLIGAALLAACVERPGTAEKAYVPVNSTMYDHLESIAGQDILLRAFLQDMPKGGDLHNHLYGAVYAESWLEWAAEDGLCIEKAALAIRFPANNGCTGALTPAGEALSSQAFRNRMIDHVSMRDFVPAGGESGHDQFFETFGALASAPHRFGDMLADTANLAGRQNISYLELMHTMELFETILPMTAGLQLSGDPAADYALLMDGQFGAALPEMVARAMRDTDAAMAEKDEILGCGTAAAQPGCSVEIRFLNQPVRTLPPAAVYAHFIFGWHLMEKDDRFVGSNLVAPEDDFIALRDYSMHMAQMGYLHERLGPRNIALHAGELTLGLVHPKEMRFHITEAVRVARASRIGHGIGIVFEDNYKDLLAEMAEREIAVEVNLTSNDTILGVTGKAHPYWVYKNAGVPMTLSTDDEGVSRIDLTHEYMRAVQELDMNYDQIKAMSYNALEYSFLDAETKGAMLSDLDEKFIRFEAKYRK